MATTELCWFLIDFALALITLAGTVAIMWGWVMWLASRATRSDGDGGLRAQALPSISPGAWGYPDVAPPATSAGARAEIAELEALWKLPARRAGTGPTSGTGAR
jgi:hypothetical protein